MPHSAASDLGLHCLPINHLGVSSLNGLNCICFMAVEGAVFNRKHIIMNGVMI